MRNATAILALACGVATSTGAQVAPGRDLFIRADKGHCIACHQLSGDAGLETRANLGPRLDGERMRALGRAGIRQAIADPTRANPDTVMPPFARHRLLDAAEIDRLVELLHALP